MPSSRTSRRAMAIARNQRHSARDLFLVDVRNSLPRVGLGATTDWQAGGVSIERSIEGDRWLLERGFDRWGNPVGADRS